jgi:hypothetical protein
MVVEHWLCHYLCSVQEEEQEEEILEEKHLRGSGWPIIDESPLHA